jgi:hypothetical protein
MQSSAALLAQAGLCHFQADLCHSQADLCHSERSEESAVLARPGKADPSLSLGITGMDEAAAGPYSTYSANL